ncbi:zinc transporter ZIP1-like [Sabethes cyaneus]|uniref:zinc transporter ZIP1-like n=1 Tax=Sabethes cyaneus TaxID=53552 RepID=UPI00237E89D2|nr:zinc transporter ZIP1-like [Sabethes cyaneus]
MAQKLINGGGGSVSQFNALNITGAYSNESSDSEETSSKLLAILVLGAGSLIAGIVPLYCIKQRQHGSRPAQAITVLLCFGAGVLLATALVHMLPEVRLFLPRFAEVVFCSGYFLIYTIDELVFLCSASGLKNTSESTGHENYCYDDSFSMRSKSEAENNENPPEVQTQQPEPTMMEKTSQPPQQHQSATGTFSLLLALCVHSLLEGLAIGVQRSAPKVMLLLGAVSAHKFVVAFCLGVEIGSQRSNHQQHRHASSVMKIVIFSLGSVSGIAIGMALDGLDENFNKFVIPLLQGVAGGTLLYVTVSEVLPRERGKRQPGTAHGIWQLAAVLAGFAVMSFLSLIITEA